MATDLTNCPQCNRKLLPEDEQPYPSLHARSIKYECGAQLVYVIGGDYWEWEKECPVMETRPEEISDGK